MQTLGCTKNYSPFIHYYVSQESDQVCRFWVQYFIAGHTVLTQNLLYSPAKPQPSTVNVQLSMSDSSNLKR